MRSATVLAIIVAHDYAPSRRDDTITSTERLPYAA
jgi:hypothetical protein